jgi:hypothetical protein
LSSNRFDPARGGWDNSALAPVRSGHRRQYPD